MFRRPHLALFTTLALIGGCGADLPEERKTLPYSDSSEEDFSYAGGDGGVVYEYNDSSFLESCDVSERLWSENLNFASVRPDGWEPTCFFPERSTSTGRYTNKQNDPFEITVDSHNVLEFDKLTPYEVAELVYWMIAAHALMDLPCASSRTPYNWLSKGHFVIVEDFDVFNELYNNPEKDLSKTGAYVKSGVRSLCYETPEGVYWSSVIRPRNWNRKNVSVVVHEMTHVMSMAVNGHSDPEHADPRLWKQAGEEQSLMSIVKKVHDCQYFPLTCPGAADPEL